jgi:uncharacterized protein YukE
MEKDSYQFNSSIENICQDVSAADSVINELDQMFYRATQQSTTQSYQTVSSQLNDLSQSYHELKKLLKIFNN